MFRHFRACVSMACLLAVGGVLAERLDFTDQLMPLTQLASDKQYREAIAGYRKLQAQAGTPGWLKAESESEIADLHAALGEIDEAIAALARAVQLGADDCLAPRASPHLAPLLKNPKAAQAISEMKISESDFLELAWLQREVEHAEHDAKLMLSENISRVDQQPTEVPQARLPTRRTTSAGVLYWRQQLLIIQKAQREFVKQSDEERMVHAATMAVAAGGADDSAVLESARNARNAAESRSAEIAKRAFVPLAAAGNESRPCSVWAQW